MRGQGMFPKPSPSIPLTDEKVNKSRVLLLNVYFNYLLGGTIDFPSIDLIDHIMRILSVNSAPNRLCCPKNLLHDSGELLGHGARPHDAGSGNDVINGNVPAVLDVLNLLSVPWRLLQGLDDQGGS